MGGALKRVESILLFLFLLLIPTQLGKHFWPEWSYVLGIRVDYLSPTLYLLDLIWIGLLILQFINYELRITKLKKTGDLNRFSFFGVLSLLFVGLNVIVAANRWVAVYRWLRIGQWLVTIHQLSLQQLRIKKYLRWIIPVWIVFESLLGLAQVVKGGSLDGIFYWLGERKFSFTTIGVAQFSVLGQGLLRAYGTFSHPNSLAGFLLVSLILWLGIKKKDLGGIGKWIVIWCGVLGIILAGSRAVWVLAAGLVIYYLRFMNKKKILGAGLVGIGVVILVLTIINENYRIADFLGGWDNEGLTKRMSLNWTAIKMIKDNPLFGVGAGNFLVRLPEYQKNNSFFWLQPVHNIVLLGLSEVGILGIIMIIFLLKGLKIYDLRFMNKKLLLIVILITGMVDHYWITLPQNWWLLGIILGI